MKKASLIFVSALSAVFLLTSTAAYAETLVLSVHDLGTQHDTNHVVPDVNGVYGGNIPIVFPNLVWTSNNPSVATILSQTAYAAHSIGNATLTATNGNDSGSTTVKVRELSSLAGVTVTMFGNYYLGPVSSKLITQYDGTPIANKTVIFTTNGFDGPTYCTARTTATGMATCFGIGQAGTNNIYARFLDDGYYAEARTAYAN